MTFWSTVPGFASFRHEIEGEFMDCFLVITWGGGRLMMPTRRRVEEEDLLELKSRPHCRTPETVMTCFGSLCHP
jgi:hypothetical protein